MLSHRHAPRSYVLPSHCLANIPPFHEDGAPGAYEHARGVLAEVSRRLRADPVSVHVEELEFGPARWPLGIQVTAVVRRETEDIAVVSRKVSAPYAPADAWQLTINGTVPQDGTGRYCPELAELAQLVWAAWFTGEVPPSSPVGGDRCVPA